MSGGKGGGATPTGDALLPLLKENYASAQGLSAKPFTPYTGQLTPGVPQAVNSGITAATGVSTYKPQTVTAPTATASSITAPTANAPTAKAADAGKYQTGLGGLSAYMNPYIASVADQTLAGIDRQRLMSLNQGSADAAMSGAFGGDRHGVADSLTNEAYGRISADALANLYSSGFDKSAGLLMGDRAGQTQNQQFNAGLQQQTGLANLGVAGQYGLANQGAGLQASLANQGAGLQASLANQGAGLQAQQANQQAGLYGAGMNLDAAKALGSLGGLQYGMQSDPLQAQYQEFLRQVGFPYQQQDVLNKALGMFGTMQGQYNQGQYPFASALGGGLGGLGMGLGNQWGQP